MAKKAGMIWHGEITSLLPYVLRKLHVINKRIDGMPLQVIVLALVLSFIIKRDSEVIDYEDAFGKMKTVDDINLKGVWCFW